MKQGRRNHGQPSKHFHGSFIRCHKIESLRCQSRIVVQECCRCKGVGSKVETLLNVDDFAQLFALVYFVCDRLRAQGWYELSGFIITSPYTFISIISTVSNRVGFGESVPNRSQRKTY